MAAVREETVRVVEAGQRRVQADESSLGTARNDGRKREEDGGSSHYSLEHSAALDAQKRLECLACTGASHFGASRARWDATESHGFASARGCMLDCMQGYVLGYMQCLAGDC